MFKKKYRIGKQKDRLLKYLSDKSRVTPFDIFKDCWICDYNSVIRYLRKDGYVIDMIEERKKNKYGYYTRITYYNLLNSK